jgi:hypothetical protein
VEQLEYGLREDFLQKDPTPKTKKKDARVVKEEIPLTTYLKGFTAHIGMAVEDEE